MPPRVEPTIYFITPSYPRREQVAELTRLGQTLMHVSNLHWIVADDNRLCNAMVMELLKQFGKLPTENNESNSETWHVIS